VTAEESEAVVSETEAGTRLEAFVRSRFPGSSLTQARRVITDGLVRVNDRHAPKGYRLKAGDRVRVEQAPARADWTPVPGAVDGVQVVYEDAELLAVAKPAGIPSVPQHPEETGTVANALAAHDPGLIGLGRTPRDAGLISRLDNGTSGLLVAGRTRTAFAELLRANAAGELRKGYLALVEGVRRTPWPTRIRRPLETRGPRGATVVAGAEAEDGAVPETRILRARSGTEGTLIVAELRHGERHQIRAHLAAIGHPVWGDVERGGRPLGDGERLALHAAWIDLPHPRTGHRLRLETPPMEPLASALRTARLPVRLRDEP
jgi:RluA family pseudouridine synthase